MADEDFTQEELELLDQIIADLKAINRRLSNSVSAGEKNSGADPMLVNLTPSEIEATMVMESHEHFWDDCGDQPKMTIGTTIEIMEFQVVKQKEDKIEDPVDESLDPVNKKRTMQVTDSLKNYRLGDDIGDQFLKPFILEILPTTCTVLQYPQWVIMTGMDSTEPSLVQTDENQLLLLTPVSPRLPPKPPDSSYGTMGFAEPSHSRFKKINAGEDATMKIMSFSQQGHRAICILSASGTISNVTLHQPTSSSGTLTYEGRFEILSLSGSFMPTENGVTESRSGGMRVFLAGLEGRVMGGGLAGLLVVAGPVQVASFIPGHQQKSKKLRMKHISTTATTHVNPISAEEIKSSFGGVKPIMMTPGAFQVDNNYVSYNNGQTGAIHLKYSQCLPKFIKQTSMLNVYTEVSVKILEDVMVCLYYGPIFNGYWFATLSNLVISQALKHALCYQSVAVGPENEFHWHFCNFNDSNHWQFWDGVEFHFCKLLISICRNNNMLLMRIIQISITLFTSKLDIIGIETKKSCQYVVWNFWCINEAANDLQGPKSIGSVFAFPASMRRLDSFSENCYLKLPSSVYNYMMRGTSIIVFKLRLKHYSASYFIKIGMWCLSVSDEIQQGLILASVSGNDYYNNVSSFTSHLFLCEVWHPMLSIFVRCNDVRKQTRYVTVWRIDSPKKQSATCVLAMETPVVFLDSRCIDNEKENESTLCGWLFSATTLVNIFFALLDSEFAHTLAVSAAARGWVPKEKRAEPSSLELEVWGRKFSKSLGLTAGFDNNAQVVEGLLALGFGFVEVGSVTHVLQDGKPKPRIFRLRSEGAVINRCGFNNDGIVAVAKRLDAQHDKRKLDATSSTSTSSNKEVNQAGKIGPGILGVNLGKNKTSKDAAADYVQGSHATWDDHSINLEAFSYFNLEDKVIFKGDGIVTNGNASSAPTPTNPHAKPNKKGNSVRKPTNSGNEAQHQHKEREYSNT